MTERSRFWDGSTTGDAVSITDDELMGRYFRALFNGTGDQGVLRGWLNELEVTDPVIVDTVTVDTGGAIVYGIWYESDATVNVNINAYRGGNCLIVVRASWATQTARIVARAVGALTQTPGVTYEIPLANVAIDGAGTVGVITDTRDYCEFSAAMLDDAITTDAIQDDAVTTAKLENQTRWISRGLNTMEADGTNPAAITYGCGYYSFYSPQPYRPYWSFATGAYNSVWLTFQVPSDFVAAGSMTVYVWTQRAGIDSNSGDATDMRWGFSSWRAAASGVLANDTGAATISYPKRTRTAVTPPYYWVHTYPNPWRYTERDSIGTFSPVAGDIVHMEVYRDGTHVDDIYGSAGALFMVEIEYTADS